MIEILMRAIEALFKRVEALEKEVQELKQDPKTGHWIFKNDNIAIPSGYYECSKCREGKLVVKDNFCPSCGAKMVESEGINE